jgi:enoyl-CoA hydratase
MDPQRSKLRSSRIGFGGVETWQSAPMSQPGAVTVEHHERVLLITINRPSARNAVNREVAEGVDAAIDRVETDPGIRVGVLTGSGGNFCSGMDLKAFAAGTPGDRPSEIAGRGFAGLTERTRMKPLIAAVEGYALAGGCELVLACDIVIASTTARFGLPEVTRGLVAGSGGAVRLARRIPPQIAMEFALTGSPMSADDAHRWGLVNRLVEPGYATAEALQLAAAIAQNAPLAVMTTKRIVDESQDWPLAESWLNQREWVDAVLRSRDALEGATAFAEKRVPDWTGT